MKPHRQKRLFILLYIVIGLGLTMTLVLYALKQNISLYYTPTQVLSGAVPPGNTFRVGGLVKKGTLIMDKKNLAIRFEITDLKVSMPVTYQGVLPDLFREGQGVVAEGTYDAATHRFMALQILAKHDANYMPPEVADELKQNAA